jgi:hypothetical protein
LTDEARFVVSCVRAALATQRRTDTQNLTTLFGPEPAVSWKRVIEIADGNAVLPLVAKGLNESNLVVPSDVSATIQERTRHNGAQNLVLANALSEVIDVFDSAGVRAIPFKGPVLATSAYGDLSRRTFGDVDVLVPPEDQEAARQTVESIGYERVDPYRRPDIERSRVLGRTKHEYEFHREDDDSTVELRWAFDTRGLPSFETLWNRRTTCRLLDTEVPMLSPLDVVLTQTTHLTEHACRRLAWVADVAAATTLVTDWEQVLGAAGGRELSRRVSVALRLAVDRFDAPVPDRIWEDGGLPDCSDVAASAHERWLASPVDTTTLFDEFRFETRLLPSLSAARAIAHTLFVPRHDEYEAFPLPPALHLLYYLYRPLRLGWLYLPWSSRVPQR